MKKIGLITWHSLENYGSVLQTYALSTILNKNGYNVEVINYVKGAKKGAIYKIYRGLKFHFKGKKNSYWHRTNQFLNFRKKYLHETKLYNSIGELRKYCDKYDIFICGSDQIWTPNRLDTAYFLEFTNKPKISYAPSIVIDDIKKGDFIKIKSLLNEFSFISVREKKGEKILSKIIDKEIKVVLDPTLLLNKSDYEDIIKNVNVNEPYLLCYLIGDKIEHRTLVSEIASKFNLKIVTLPFKKFDENFGDFVLKGIGPQEFLGLINNSKLVCTDSYHCMLLSIMLEKNFYEIPRFSNNDKMSQNARVNEVIDLFNLNDRLINNIDDVNFDEIDYSKVNEIKKIKKEESLNYLKNALKGVIYDNNSK